MTLHDPRTIRAFLEDGSLHCFNGRDHLAPVRLTDEEEALVEGATGQDGASLISRERGPLSRLRRLAREVVGAVARSFVHPHCVEFGETAS